MKLERAWHQGAIKTAVRVSGLRALYLNNLLRGLAGSMVSIFYPAYVYLWGYEKAGVVYGLRVLIVAIALERGLVFLFSMPIGRLVYKIGFKMSILVSSLTLSLWFLLPVMFGRSLGLIMALSIVSAITIPMYWLARLSILTVDGEKKSYGEEVSFLSLLDQVSSILGPFVGGVLVAVSGFGLLFGVATFICILSAIPIFFVGDYKINDGISLKGLWRWLNDKKERHLHWAFVGQGFANDIDGYFWPLFIFITVGSFTVVGTITSITFALASISIYLAGKIFDQKRALGGSADEKEYTLATVMLSGMTLLRPLLRTTLAIFGFDVVFRMALPFWGVDHDAYLYSAGKRARSALEFYAYREILYSGARVVGPFILFLFAASPYFWWVAFVLGSLGTLLTLGMQKES